MGRHPFSQSQNLLKNIGGAQLLVARNIGGARAPVPPCSYGPGEAAVVPSKLRYVASILGHRAQYVLAHGLLCTVANE